MTVSPSRYGPFEVIEPLGRGGMGVVHRARDHRDGSLVALKTVDRLAPRALAAMRREVGALARLDHPGIARVLDHGAADGVPWYAMELIDGAPLRAWCRAPQPESGGDWWTHTMTRTMTDPLSSVTDAVATIAPAAPGAYAPPRIGPILTAMKRVCDALAFVHGEGLLHLDVKPDNILVRPDGTPVLVDFGLATALWGEAHREALPQDPRLAGTLAYIAPERLRRDRVDARADLYSLGCTLYELVTAAPPFRATSDQALVSMQLSAPPRAPSGLVPDLDPDLEALILALLAKAPEDRPGYASDVAKVLVRLGADPRDPRPAPPARPYLYRARCAGRRAELDRLRRELDRLESGRGWLTILFGESGVGKTRLARELVEDAAQRGLTVLLAECVEAAPPLAAVRPALERVADQRLASGDTAPSPPSEDREALLDAVVADVASLAEEAPLLLVVDDLQWADELSLSALERLVGSERVGILATARSETPRPELFGLAGRGQRIDLSRLDEAALAEMVADMLAIHPAPDDLVRWVAGETEGNPFFADAYLRAAVHEAHLGRDDRGRWSVLGGYRQLTLPEGPRTAVWRRLDALGPDARAIVDAASVLGRESPLAAIASLSAVDAERCAAELDGLSRHHVLHPAPADPERARFDHDKIRELTLEKLLPARRRALHAAAAAWLEAHRPGAHAEIAAHWERASEPTRAAAAHLLAANAAARAFAHSEAEASYRACLRLTRDPATRATAWRDLAATVLVVRGRYDEAATAFAEALDAARRSADPLILASVLEQQSRLETERARFEVARAAIDEALEILRPAGDGPALAQALATSARLYRYQAAYDDAALDGEAAVAMLARIGGDIGDVAGDLIVVYIDLGRHDEARALAERLLDGARERGHRRRELKARGTLGVVSWHQGRYPEAELHFRAALALARELGDGFEEGANLNRLACSLWPQGRPLEALAHYREALEALRPVGNQFFTQDTLRRMAELVRLATGDLPEAARLNDESEAIARATGHRYGLAFSLRERAQQALMRRAIDEAEALTTEAEALVEALGARPASEVATAVATARRALEATRRREPVIRGEAEATIHGPLLAWLAGLV